MFLLDGFVAGTWKLVRSGTRRAVVEISPFEDLTKADTDAVGAEAEELLAFAAPAAADRDIHITAVS